MHHCWRSIFQLIEKKGVVSVTETQYDGRQNHDFLNLALNNGGASNHVIGHSCGCSLVRTRNRSDHFQFFLLFIFEQICYHIDYR